MMNEFKTVVITDSNFQAEVMDCTKPILLEFWAEWRGANHILEPILQALALKYYDQIKIGKLDIDRNQKIVDRFSIYSMPTILFFKHGRVIDSVQGTVPSRELEEKILALLSETT
ncbi:thioredoxin family protein [candidate division CSSED10-310 bacterium]|uniref:Thioredoxin n=1 Tax=candidate division CSSED10-310 bacterium TaxID=2855610 RepID=A0ABV6YW83_UNCC1